jgi:hypothetical protein
MNGKVASISLSRRSRTDLLELRKPKLPLVAIEMRISARMITKSQSPIDTAKRSNVIQRDLKLVYCIFMKVCTFTTSVATYSSDCMMSEFAKTA